MITGNMPVDKDDTIRMETMIMYNFDFAETFDRLGFMI